MTIIRNIMGFSALRTATITAPRTTLAQSAAFTTSTKLSLKESSDKDNVDFESHKQESLKKQKQGKGYWKPELASDSEEAVKADRAPRGEEDTATLQEKTKRAAEQSRKTGGSVHDTM